ncbi:MAG: outer membrane lipoprotein carrier protein LolA [Elusimicrobiota bacterium]|jgi:outer membrane lipoprotein-sorting protein|nr:outer membrane lipoprotein carrier protein LolA [Elusimicrobiota bacterium]
MKTLKIFLTFCFVYCAAVTAAAEVKTAPAGKPSKPAQKEAAPTAKAAQRQPTAYQPRPCAQDSKECVINNFTAWDKNLRSAAMFFEQKTTFEGMDISASNGRIYKKGNAVRLDTFGPDGKITQSAVTDKKTIRILDEKGQKITALPWKEWQDSQANKALFDFGNYAALLQTHKITEFEKTEDGYKIALTPEEGSIYRLEFLLGGKDYFPYEISISSDGVDTRTRLTGVEKNINLKESLFK